MSDATSLRPNESGGTKYSPPEAVRLGETQLGRGCTSPSPVDEACHDGGCHSHECATGSGTNSYPCQCKCHGHSANATCDRHGNSTHDPCYCRDCGNGVNEHHH